MPTTSRSTAPSLRRSSNACSKCHERKVRCDVTASVGPCSNCRVNKVDCIILKGKKRGRRKKHLQLATSAAHEMVASETGMDSHSFDYQVNGARTSGYSLDCQVGKETPRHIDQGSSPSSEANYKLPDYIKPVPLAMEQDDIDCLARKNVFMTPTNAFRNACVGSYIHWVHFFCPLLDLHEFLSAIAHPDGLRGQLSLLLFYAVMLGGATFAPDSEIVKAKYKSRLAARKDLFSRCKALYSANYESDRVVIVQSLLIMSYWQEKHDEPTNHWYWSELGCLVARTIGLFRDPADANLSERNKRLRRRVGWSCILRDRVLNLGVRMPPKIKRDEFRLPILSEADFNLGAFDTDITNLLPDCHLLRDIPMQIQLARMCIEKTKLCIALGKVFDCLYEESHPKLGTNTEATLILLPVAERARTISALNLEQELQDWSRSLPDDLQPGKLDLVVDEESKILFLHRSVLQMFYETVQCTFYRPMLLAGQCSNDNDIDHANARLAKQKMAHHTMLITRSFEDLEDQGLLQFLPSTCVTFLLTAAVNHLVEHKAAGQSTLQRRHLRRFQDCLAYMKVLKGVHVYAKYADILLRRAALHAGVAKYSAVVGGMGGDKSEERDDLGPWGTAHSPGPLISGYDRARQKETNDFGSSRGDCAAATIIHSHLPVADPLLAQNVPAAYGMAATATVPDCGAPGHFLDGNPICDIGSLSDGSDFLGNTLWEHGWINQMADVWPEDFQTGYVDN